MSAITETALGELAEDADTALRQLYARYAHPLRKYVERFGPDLASADDIVQETFTRAWPPLPQLAADDQLVRPWLFRVARNLLIDAARGARSRPVTVEARPDLDLRDEDQFDQLMDRQLVAEALQQLSPAHRMVLVETFYRGGTTAMVARQLGIPPGTARSRLHYALNALREQLQNNVLGEQRQNNAPCEQRQNNAPCEQRQNNAPCEQRQNNALGEQRK